MFATRAKLPAFLVFYFCVSFTVADPRAVYIHRRDGSTTPSTITEISKTQSSSPTESIGSTAGRDGAASTSQPDAASGSIISSSASTNSSDSTSASTAATPTSSDLISVIPSNINGAAPTSGISTSAFNETATPGKLPLTPEVTPAFAVAGVILLLSGSVYTLVGIKNKHLHICLSAGYLASLAVTVLIIYILNPPISDAIQGAYLVAVTMTGIVLGGAAIVFTEMTEGLGCLLGGFCLSMWFLALKPGGLLTPTSAKAGFIAAFTVAGFATSFSHITRPYALIGFISFGGATAVVLGIDCVSRAGLKEFWAYIWNLNNNLFPVGATTYPLTRGMKVELAAIIVIFFAGIMSQMKLWKVIKERRDQRAAERLEDERTIQKEEENVGKRIEQHNAQERNQWEAVYGDREFSKTTENQSNRDSGLGDMESQKKGPTSTVTSLRRSGEDDIEMTNMPSPTSTTGAGLVMNDKGQDSGPITVRVARDPEYPIVTDENGNAIEQPESRLSHMSSRSSPPEAVEEEEVWVVGADSEARLERRPSKRDPRQNAKPKSASPVLVPLPFKVPDGEIPDDSSSVATFADDEPAMEKRHSKRLSASSAFLRRLSKRSNRSSKRFSAGIGESTEELVIHRAIDERPISRASSLVATMDGLSDDEEMRSVRSSIVYVRDTDDIAAPQSLAPDQADATHSNIATATASVEDTPQGVSTIPANTAILGSKQTEGECEGDTSQKLAHEVLPLTSATDQEAGEDKATSEKGKPEDSEKPATGTPSVVSAAESKPATLTKESLPPKLSKVVMSYRTNEWAKHLSTADAPVLEELHLAEYPAEVENTVEEAAPVNVVELQQTPENAIPAPARPASQISINSTLSRSVSKTNMLPYPPRPEMANAQSLSRSTSQLSLNVPPTQPQLNPRSLAYRSSSTPLISQPIVESPIEEEAGLSAPNLSRNPYGSQPTLLGKRDTMIKSKSSLYIGSSPLSSMQDLSQPQSLPQFHSSVPSQVGSDEALPDDDNMPLSQRRNLIRQSSSLVQQPPIPFDTHQPRRQSSAPHPLAREQQLASFRASMQNEYTAAVKPRATIERQRSQLWMEKQAEEQKRALEGRMKEARDRGFDERMRRGDMLGAHRNALRKMQAKANGNT